MSNMLIRTDDSGPWQEPKDFRFDLEAHLQDILAAHPQLIPGVDAGAKVCKEFQSDAGYTDLVVVDADSSITLVECKLASNPQIRRKIVGQLFDYASRFWKMNVTEFEEQWLSRAKGSKNHPLFGDSSEQNLRLRDDLAKNLEVGRFRLVFAVDKINPALRRMVEYLNAMAGPETVIIAVEYNRLRSENIEILMPETYGEEIAEAKIVARERQQRTWSVEEYRAWLAENDSGNAEKFSRLIAAGEKLGMPFKGSAVGLKGSIPAGGLRITNENCGWVGTLYIYHYSGGRTSLELSFANKENSAARECLDPALVDSFLTSLANIPTFKTASDTLKASDFARRPNVPLSKVGDSELDSLVTALSRLKADPAPSAI